MLTFLGYKENVDFSLFQLLTVSTHLLALLTFKQLCELLYPSIASATPLVAIDCLLDVLPRRL